MIKYIIKKLLYSILVVFGVVVVEFFIFHALPGDPVKFASRASASTRQMIIQAHGLDKPVSTQFVLYINDLSLISIHEDTPKNKTEYQYTPLFSVGKNVIVLKLPYLRRSFQTYKKVADIILENITGTIWLTLTAMIFATLVGVLFGLIAALYQGSSLDRFLVALSVLGISAPSFVMAVLISITFGYYLHEWTGLNTTGSLWDNSLDGKKLRLHNLILPAFTLGIRPLAIITQITRSSMLEVMSQDYIRTAKAKGLNNFKIILKHALKNALNPVVSTISNWFAVLMAGTFFIEHIFMWKGIGLVTLQAVENNDIPVIMGSSLFVAIAFMFINIVVDVVYKLLDPRVNLE